MVRVGLLVNPDAGLGGRLGLKGSDGQAEIARSMGAEDRSGPRMRLMLEHFINITKGESLGIEWFVSEGRMGTRWIPEALSPIVPIHSSLRETYANDTNQAIKCMIESDVDLILYAGGDGTTRDIVASLSDNGKPNLPIIGVPTGVKMHSDNASRPRRYRSSQCLINQDLLLASTEVLDLDDLTGKGNGLSGFMPRLSPPQALDGCKAQR